MLILVSCTKIQPIESNTQIKENWVDLNQETWIYLEEEKMIKARFELLANKYPNHNELMDSIQYEQFVLYIHEIFNKYNEQGKEISEEKNNYMFELVIPWVVFENYVWNGRISETEGELIVQSVKRNDLNTLEDKELITQKFKIYFEEKKFNPLIKNMDFNNISKDQKIDILLKDKEWAIYAILSNRYNWNKTWIWYKPGEMEANFMKYLNWKVKDILWVSWITENELKDYFYKKNNINSLETLWESILNDFNVLNDKYSLESQIPLKRYFRDDERNSIFKDRESVNKYIDLISWWKSEDFISELEIIRFKIYLLSYFWRDRLDLNETQWLWSSRTRSDFISEDYWKWIQNLFRLGRYLPWEEVKIDLNKENLIIN